MTRIGWTLLALVLAPSAQAGSFGIAPTSLELDAAHPIQVITVHNQGDDSTLMQVRAVAWSQTGGEEHYEPTHELLVAPPVFELPPGQDQVIRVALRRDPDSARELAYRLFVQEVPGALPAGTNGLRVALQISLPVFVQPLTANAKPDVQWLARRVDGQLDLTAINATNTHLHIQKFDLRLPGMRKPLPVTTARYVLPGSQVDWRLDLPDTAPADTTLEIHGISNLGDFAATAPLASR